MPTPSEKLRDRIIAVLKAHSTLNAYAIELVEKNWRPDPKYDRKMSINDKAASFRRRRAELIASGTKASEADEKLYRDANRASPEAFNRWLRDNRLLRRPVLTK
jgi:hypothetical protein